MVFEWLAREGWIVLSWWLLVTLAGAAVFPMLTRLLGALPDRGYTLARAAGLLLVGYAYWILGSLGFLRNSTGGILLAWLIVLAIGLMVYTRGGRFDWRGWWRENRTVVIAAEVLFALLFLGWTLFRAHQNGLTGTEKPMDLMFISSIIRSDIFPPNDGWLSGYSISYYYFGYFIMAMLSMVSGVASTTGYNLSIALLFALTGLTLFGVVYNLVRSRALNDPRKEKVLDDGDVFTPSRRPAITVGVLAVVMTVLMGNFQAALIELPFQLKAAPESYLAFWNMQERALYPEREQANTAGIAPDAPVTLGPGRSDPADWDFWWWFRASRVLTDFNLDGTVAQGAQPIDEFPQFSFLLADNHPHVMALPFAALALGLALNLLLTGRAPNRAEVLLYAFGIGGLIFLNTWDGPIYLIVLIGAEGLRRLMRGGGSLSLGEVGGTLLFGVTVAVLGVLLYLPFLISFRSQASGILPNLISPTLFQHYFIMFGPFLLILGFFLAIEIWRGRGQFNWRFGIQAGLVVLALCVFVMLGLVLAASLVPSLRDVALNFAQPYGGISGVIGPVLGRRLETLLTTLVLVIGLVIIAARLFPKRTFKRVGFNESASEQDAASDAPNQLFGRSVINYPMATGFALLVMGAGIGLTLVPEYFYLRDNFGTRINTIFKFYYQAWLLFSVASAYAIYTLLADSRMERPSPAIRGLFGAVVTLVIGLGMVYPVLGIHNRMFVESGRLRAPEPAALTLDGGSSMILTSDYTAIQCWKALVGDDKTLVVAEAVGPAYNPQYGRVAGLTGVPIVMGWENHERQWRGSTYDQAAGNRAGDISQLYNDLRWDTVLPIIERYGIDYIFYGNSERSAYGSAGEEKFRENLEPVCEFDGSLFYRVTSNTTTIAAVE